MTTMFRIPWRRLEIKMESAREQLFYVFEDFEERSTWHSPLKLCMVVGMTVMILVSLICLVLETEPALADTPPVVWEVAEAVTTCTFTVEYLLRLWVCDVFGLSKVAWALRPMNVCDLFAILPFYAEFFVSSDISWLRVLRVVRLVKLGRYSKGVQVMTMALINSMQALYILTFIFFMGMIMFASIVYFTEKLSCPEFDMEGDWGLDHFRLYDQECMNSTSAGDGTSPTFGTCCAYLCQSVPVPLPSLCQYESLDPIVVETRPARPPFSTTLSPTEPWEIYAMHELSFSSVFPGMWWAAVTMTTVGYGDIVPKNWLSKCVACVAMITGMLIIAMPFAIVGTKFGEAVAVCEAGDARSAAVARLKKVRQFGGVQSCGSAQGGACANGLSEDDLLRFEELKNALKTSKELKQEIMKVQQLRDNLWTSVEHAMASFALEGIYSLRKETLLNMYNPDGGNDDDKFCEWSCYIFHRDLVLRRWAIRLSHSSIFEYVVISAILANSVIMANQDYYPRETVPWQNQLQESTEIPFIAFFTFECVSKIMARGFILDRHSYMRDAWNWIDFLVVVTGLALTISEATTDSQGPDLAVLRVVRVLRPLRTLSALPGLRKLVNTILRSLPGLKDVVLMACFLLAVFGILGIHFYGGLMHRRCRITPQPLHFTYHAQEPSCTGWCFDNSSRVSLDLGTTTVEVESADVFRAFCGGVPACVQAYNEYRDYYVWPMDSSQERFCGAYECQAADESVMASWDFGLSPPDLISKVLQPMGMFVPGPVNQTRTTCGSPLDDDPNYAPATASPELKGINLDHPETEVNRSAFNWGLTHYDQIGGASLVVFQCVTLEGWVDIMYMLQDTYSALTGFAYFFLLILVGYFFLLNVILAIVYDAFCAADISQQTSAIEDTFPQVCVDGDEYTLEESRECFRPSLEKVDSVDETQSPENQDAGAKGWASWKETCLDVCAKLLRRKPAGDVNELLLQPHKSPIRNCARWVASSVLFDVMVMLIISLNVVVLSLDSYPTSAVMDRFAIEALNRACNAIFIVEFLILHVALGPLVYWCDNALAFDGVVVLLSLPDEILAITGQGGNSSLKAIRAFRLLRIFKLAKKFPSMKVLLKACVETLLCMREFVLLLAIIVCVFALVGQGFFGGKFLFDAEGRVVPREQFAERCEFDEEITGKPDCVPRAHFDTFLWSVVTIFQILTGENWNTVMYDAMRATQWTALFFFVAVMVVGQFVILNLCLSILMMNFECQRSTLTLVEKEKQAKKAPRLTFRVIPSFNSHSDTGEHTPERRKARASTLPPFPSITAMRSGSGSAIGNYVRNSLSFRGSGSGQTLRSSWRGSVRTNDQVLPTEDVLPARPIAAVPAWEREAADSNTLPGELHVESVVSELEPPLVEVQQQGCLQPPHPCSLDVRNDTPADTESSTPEQSRQTTLQGGQDEDAHRENNEVVPTPTLQNPAADAFVKYLSSMRGNSGVALTPTETSRREGRRDSQDQAISSDWPLEYFIPKSIQRTKHFSSLRRRSCCIFDDAHPLRHLCLYIAKDSRFEKVIITLITVSSALMMLQNPLHDPAGLKEVVLGWVNVAFTIIFALEMVIKMTAFGMFCGQPGRPAYLQSSWNLLDAFIVTVSVADVLQNHLASHDSASGVLGFMKVFRIARVLRPLRLISRNENLKVVVKTIGVSLPELRNLSMFSSLFFLIFALLGVLNLKGSFYRCLDHQLEDYSFKQFSGVTPLCIPPAGALADPRFTRQEDATLGACPTNWTQWQRPTRDTPICEVHCSSQSNNPFCKNTSPWGYHTMRCTDCRQEFCPEVLQEQLDDCSQTCERHEYFCEDTSSEGLSACREQCIAECVCPDRCVGLSKDAALCAEQGGRWVNSNQNFDNLIVGMISLFEICTTEGWVDLMISVSDFQGPYLQPKRDKHELLACFASVAFILIGSFFVLNLCVGVIIDNYHKQKEGRARLMVTPAQSNWISYQKALYAKRMFFVQTNVQWLPPTRQHLMRIVTSSMFENSIMACIIMNTVVLGIVIYPRPSDGYAITLDRLNIVFAFVFNVEAILKLCAMHLSYFKDGWNVFDFTCVLISDAFFVLEATSSSSVSVGNAVKGIRIFRIARLFRLVRFLKGLNQLTMAFMLSVPKLANVGFIMLLLIYLFAVLGLNLFAEVKYIDSGSYGDYANFRGFWTSMSLLIRSMTGEGWNTLMHDLSKDKFYYESILNVHCVEGLQITKANFKSMDLDGDGMVDPEFINGCGKRELAFAYFITYTLIVTFVILNLFIAVIFEGFEESRKSEAADLLEKCLHSWSRYDPNSTMYISLERALDFVDEVVDQVCPHDHNNAEESRWDPSYTGMRTDIQPLALYNLSYMRIIDLHVTHSNEVRYVVAVKAVIRRIICQGGLNSLSGCREGKEGRMERLRELEQLERLLMSSECPRGLDKELLALRRAEKRQARGLAPNARLSAMWGLGGIATKTSSMNSSGEEVHYGGHEYSLLQEVAAAKIQRRFKEAFQRRRAKLRACKTNRVHEPIARAAG